VHFTHSTSFLTSLFFLPGTKPGTRDSESESDDLSVSLPSEGKPKLSQVMVGPGPDPIKENSSIIYSTLNFWPIREARQGHVTALIYYKSGVG